MFTLIFVGILIDGEMLSFAVKAICRDTIILVGSSTSINFCVSVVVSAVIHSVAVFTFLNAHDLD